MSMKTVKSQVLVDKEVSFYTCDGKDCGREYQAKNERDLPGWFVLGHWKWESPNQCWPATYKHYCPTCFEEKIKPLL